MRILHTSDWHLGKKLEDRPRLDEQKATLKSLVEIIKNENVDVVIVAGDVFDTFTPPAEAEKLFFDVLSAITGEGVAVVIISGNHDDPTRLTASERLSLNSGVFFSNGSEFKGDIFSGKVTTLFGGKYHVAFRDKDGEEVYIAMLPYPTEARMRESLKEQESYDDKIKRYISYATDANTSGLPCVLTAHVFMLGGMPSSSERQIELGGARMVSKNAIPENVIYTALGHLHKRQVVDSERNIIYSGSILQNAFDESGYKKSVTIFDVKNGKVDWIKEVELEGYLKLERLTVNGFDEAMTALAALPDTFVELTMNLHEPLTTDLIKILVTSYPKVVLRTHVEMGERTFTSRKLMDDKELFVNFYRSLYNGSDPDDEVLQLFLRFINEIDEVEE